MPLLRESMAELVNWQRNCHVGQAKKSRAHGPAKVQQGGYEARPWAPNSLGVFRSAFASLQVL